MDRDQLATAKKVKTTVLDTANWLKCAALLRLLEPLTVLSTLMSKDQGDALPVPFFYIGMHCIEKSYDLKPYRESSMWPPHPSASH